MSRQTGIARRHRSGASGQQTPQIWLEPLEERCLLAFAHPSIVSTEADYTRMRTKVNAGAQPWLSGWNTLISQGYAQLGANPRPLQTVIRGGDGQNFNQMVIDITRTYECALRWKVSGDTRYADQAVRFLNAWSSTMTTLTGNADRFLASGLYGFTWAATADLMRSYSGWAAADVTKFQNYLVSIYYPMQHDFLTNHNGAYITNYWANWDLANVEGMMAVGIFADRQDMYDEAVDYLCTGRGNGALDKVVYYLHPGNLAQWQESGRDQGHTLLGMMLFGDIAQMAWNQGTDLFSYNNYQFLAAAEYIAKYNLWNDVPYEAYYWGNGQSGAWSSQTTLGSGSRGLGSVGYELIYAHYVELLGMAAPYTTQRVMALRPEASAGNGDSLGFGTLVFSLDPVTTSQAPRGLTALEEGTGRIELDWFGGANDTSYNIYRATSDSGSYTKIASGITDLLSYTDRDPSAGVYYYKITGVSGSGETAASNVVSATATNLLQTQLLFNETSGTSAADAAGNNHTGTLNNGATWTTGKSGNAVLLDGVNDYVSLPSGIVAGMSDFTISAWVYLNSVSTWSRIFDFGDSRGRWMYLTPKNGSGVIEFATSTTYGYNKESVAGTAALPTMQWVHVAVTLSDHTATIYVNGVAVGSNSSMDFPPYEIGSTTNNWIGRSQYASDPYLSGKVDDFRIYRGSLSAGEVYTLAAAGTAPASVSFQVNDASIQRSMVTSLTVSFDRPAMLTSDAITLSLRGGSIGFSVLVSNPSGNGRDYVLTFVGSGVVGSSLPDGVYDLSIRAAGVSNGYGQILSGGDRSFAFHRLYGDVNGDGTVDLSDSRAFRTALAGTYNAAFDYNGDGMVDLTDSRQFRLRIDLSLIY